MNLYFVVIGILFIFNSISNGLSLVPSNRNCATMEPTAIDDAECKKYYICVYDETGSLVSYDISCPASMVFDPSVKKCVSSTNFVCKTTSTNTTPGTRLLRAQCNGRFPVDGNCKEYTFCYANGSPTTISYSFTCPNGLAFNRITQKCVFACKDGKCPPCQ